MVSAISFETSGMKRKAIGFAVGLGISALGILLLNHFPAHEVAVQVSVWSIIVVAIVIGPHYPHFRERWFWKAWLLVAVLHVVIIASFLRSLPFSSLGVAILMSFPEAVVFLFVFRVMADSA